MLKKSYQQLDCGLYVPIVDGSFTQESETNRQLKHEEIRAIRRSANAAVLALFVSVLSLILGLLTLNANAATASDAHQATVRQQAEQVADQERESRRFADQVTVWDERRVDDTIVHVYNRSATLLNDVIVSNSHDYETAVKMTIYGSTVNMGTLPACSEVSFAIPSLGSSWFTTAIHFSDPEGSWIKGGSGRPYLIDGVSWWSRSAYRQQAYMYLSQRDGGPDLLFLPMTIKALQDCAS